MTRIMLGSEEANRIAAGTRPHQMVTAGGLIEFAWWPDAPSIYATETQLKQAGLKPGGPAVARVRYGRGRNARSYLLYDGRAAVPRKQVTPAQRAALEKAQRARRLLASGAGLAVVQRTLGHNIIATTGMYVTPNDEELRDAMERATP